MSKFSRASIFVMIFFYLSTEQLHITHETSRMALFTICEMTEIQPKEGLRILIGFSRLQPSYYEKKLKDIPFGISIPV